MIADTQTEPGIGARSPRQIEGEIDEARRHLDETIDELSDRLDPKVILSEAAHNTQDRLAHVAKDHPIPVALMAASLIWMSTRACLNVKDGESAAQKLAAAAKKNGVPLALASTSLLLLGGQAYARTPKGRQQVARLKEKATELAHEFEQKAGEISHQVADATKDLRETVNQQMAVAGHKLEEAGHQLAERTQDFRENVNQKVTEAGHKLEEVGHQVADRTKDLRDNLSQKVDEVKEFDAREALNKASAQVKDFGSEVAHRVVEAKDTVKENLKETGHQIQEAGRAALDQVKDKAHRLEERFETNTQNYPLITGLGFLALGIAAAVALPRTTPENRAIGHLAKDVKDRVRGEGEKLVQKTKQTVDEAVTEVKEEVRQENEVIQPEAIAS